jgi:hypothetical protein
LYIRKPFDKELVLAHHQQTLHCHLLMNQQLKFSKKDADTHSVVSWRDPS